MRYLLSVEIRFSLYLWGNRQRNKSKNGKKETIKKGIIIDTEVLLCPLKRQTIFGHFDN